MRWRGLSGTLLALVIAPAVAGASTVTLTDWTTPGHFQINAPGGGGAFRAVTNGGPLGNSDFLTFCLEYTEHFSAGSTYNYGLSDRAMFGGIGGGPSGDPISDATQYLYYNARSGGYASLITGVGGALANSGWYIQEASGSWKTNEPSSKSRTTLTSSHRTR